MGSKGNIPQSSQPGAIKSFRAQTALYGTPIPLVYGEQRIAGNILWVENFQAHEFGGFSGGKKGGRVALVRYTYSASVVLGLCEGPAYSIGTAVVGGSNLSLGQNGKPTQLVARSPGCWKLKKVKAVTGSRPEGAGFWPFRGLSWPTTGGQFWPAGGVAIDNFPLVQGIVPPPDLGEGTGAYWKHAAEKFPDQAQTFPGLAYVAGKDVSLDSNASLPTFNFPVVGLCPYFAHYGLAAGLSQITDCDPADIVTDLLTNQKHGAAWPATYLADLYTGANSFSAYCRAADIRLSYAIDHQQAAASLLAEIAKTANAALVWSGGVLKIIPYGDEALTGQATGVTYNPTVEASTAGAYLGARGTITDRDFQSDDAGPVHTIRKPKADIYNAVTVEFLNRANAYAPETAEAKDAASIETGSGLVRNAPTESLHGITTAAVARATAQRLLQRQIAKAATYTFRTGWQWCLLEPMDIVLLTSPGDGLEAQPVRITSVQELENGDLEFEAEDVPIGVHTAMDYASQATLGAALDYDEAPGELRHPVVFEAPWTAELGELVLYVVGSGTGNYGGATVLLSEDGATYRQVGEVGAGIHGRLLDALPATASPDTTSSVRVSLWNKATLPAHTADEARALRGVLYIGRGDTYELVAYSAATFLGADDTVASYRLDGYLVRGAYQTGTQAHAEGDDVALLFDHLAVTIDPRLIGRKVYLKLLPRNVYGAGQPDVTTIAPIEWTVTGRGLLAPPPDVGPVAQRFREQHLVLTWDTVFDHRPLQYVIRRGATWGDGVTFATTTAPEIAIPGGGTYWIAAVTTVETGAGPRVAYSATPRQVVVSTSALVQNVVQLSDAAAEGWPGTASPYAAAILADGDGPLVYLRGSQTPDGGEADWSGHGASPLVGAGVTRVPGLIPGDPDEAFRCDGTANGCVDLDRTTHAKWLGRIGPRNNYGAGGTGMTLAIVIQRERVGVQEVVLALESLDGSKAPVVWFDASNRVRMSLGLPGTTAGAVDLIDANAIGTVLVGEMIALGWTWDGGTTHRVFLNGFPWPVATASASLPAIGRALAGKWIASDLFPFQGVVDEIVLVDRPLADETLAAATGALSSGERASIGHDVLRSAIQLVGAAPPFAAAAAVAELPSVAIPDGVTTAPTPAYYYLPPWFPHTVALADERAALLTAELVAESFGVFARFADLPSLAAAGRVAGAMGDLVTAALEVAVATGTGAQNEPDGARFGPWQAFVAGTLRAQRAKFRVRLASTTPTTSVRATQCRITADVDDLIQQGTAIANGAAGVRVVGSAVVSSAGADYVTLTEDVPASGAVNEHLIVVAATRLVPGAPPFVTDDIHGYAPVTIGPGLESTNPDLVVYQARITTALRAGDRIKVAQMPVAYVAVALRATGLATLPLVQASMQWSQATGYAPNGITLNGGAITGATPFLVLGLYAWRGTASHDIEALEPTSVRLAKLSVLLSQVALGVFVNTQTAAGFVGGGPGAQIPLPFLLPWTAATVGLALQSPTGFTRVAFPKRFVRRPELSVSIMDTPAAATLPDALEVGVITPDYFEARVKNNNVVVPRQLAWVAQGF